MSNFHYRPADIAELAVAQLLSLGYKPVVPPQELSFPEQVKWVYTGQWRRGAEPVGTPLEFKVMRVGNSYLRDATPDPSLHSGMPEKIN